MSYRSDGWLPHYIDTLPTATGATQAGQWLLLNGAIGISVQVALFQGAAGTLYIDATNLDDQSIFVTPTTQTITANGTGYFTFSMTDQVTSFAQMRCRFVATAGGNIEVAVNIRRTIP